MSPILGLSEKRRLPRLGKIHLGFKAEGAKGLYPKATDYFVCPPEVQAVFGERPKVLRIMFPTKDPNQFASQWYRRYSTGRGLVCKGDGETAMALTDTATGAMATKESKSVTLKEWQCQGEDCEFFQAKACRPVMNLQFLLPDVDGIGIWQIDTSSIFSIINVNSNIELIRNLCGHIGMIPLDLRLVEQEVQPEGFKKIVHVMDLRAPYKIHELLAHATRPLSQLLLPPPDDEVPDDLYPAEVLERAEAQNGGTSTHGQATKAEEKRPPKAAAKSAAKGEGAATDWDALEKIPCRTPATLFSMAKHHFGDSERDVLAIANHNHRQDIVDPGEDWVRVVSRHRLAAITREPTDEEAPDA